MDFEDNMNADDRDTTVNSGENWKIMAEERIRGIRIVKCDVCLTLKFNIKFYLRYEGRTESHEQLFFACELVTAD